MTMIQWWRYSDSWIHRQRHLELSCHIIQDLPFSSLSSLIVKNNNLLCWNSKYIFHLWNTHTLSLSLSLSLSLKQGKTTFSLSLIYIQTSADTHAQERIHTRMHACLPLPSISHPHSTNLKEVAISTDDIVQPSPWVVKSHGSKCESLQNIFIHVTKYMYAISKCESLQNIFIQVTKYMYAIRK